jgi:hypothetical protein
MSYDPESASFEVPVGYVKDVQQSFPAEDHPDVQEALELLGLVEKSVIFTDSGLDLNMLWPSYDSEKGGIWLSAGYHWWIEPETEKSCALLMARPKHP